MLFNQKKKKIFSNVIISIFILKLKPPSFSLCPSYSFVQVNALFFFSVEGLLVVFHLDNMSHDEGLLQKEGKQKGSISGSIGKEWLSLNTQIWTLSPLKLSHTKPWKTSYLEL